MSVRVTVVAANGLCGSLCSTTMLTRSARSNTTTWSTCGSMGGMAVESLLVELRDNSMAFPSFEFTEEVLEDATLTRGTALGKLEKVGDTS